MPPSNSRNYIHPLVGPTLPAGKLLSGWPANKGIVHCPVLPNILSEQDWDAIIGDMYPNISIEHFQVGGRLRVLLHVCLASQLMYYSETYTSYAHVEGCAGKAVLNRLLTVLSHSDTFIHARRGRTDTVHAHLLEISKSMLLVFRSKNDAPAEDSALIDLMLAQTRKMTEMQSTLQELVKESTKSNETIAALMHRVAHLEGAAASSTPSSKRKAASPATDKSPPAAAPLEKKMMVLTNPGVGKLEADGLTMSDLLYAVAEKRHMDSLGDNDYGYADGNKIKTVLHYMRIHLTADEYSTLKAWKGDSLKQVCVNVQERCMAAVLGLEGRGDEEKSKAKPKVLGFCNRLSKAGITLKSAELSAATSSAAALAPGVGGAGGAEPAKNGGFFGGWGGK